MSLLHWRAAMVGAVCVFAGFSYFAVGPDPVVWPTGISLRYLSPTSFPPDSDTDILYRSGMGQWSDVPAGDFQYVFVHATEDFPVNHFDGYNDTLAVPANTLDPGILSVTFMVNDGSSWFDMDTLFSDFPLDAGWSFETNPDCALITNPGSPNGFSFLLVSLHELGHALGLGHDPIGDEPPGTPWRPATMNPSYPMGGPVGQENIVELHADDRNGARFLYPHSGPADPPVVDLANASYAQSPLIGTAVPVFFDPPEAGPGDAIVARGLVENFGSTNEFLVHQGFYLSSDDLIDTGDLLIGEISWDLALGDAFEFDVTMMMPDDLAAGEYRLGSFLDDLDAVDEVYEDNNAVLYCQPFVVSQLTPVIEPIPQETTVAGSPYTGPAPIVTHPLNMGPITWSLDDAPAGMSVDPASGVVSWPDPTANPFVYTVIIRATNSAGTATQFLFLGVLEPPDPCPADCGPGSGDGVVNTIDLLSVLAEFGSGGPFDCDIAPLGGDGLVNTADVLLILAQWGACP